MEAGMEKRKVILVTDGDSVAQKAVEIAASNVGGRCISVSAGNPTMLTGEQIVEQIRKAEKDPVLVMADDRGQKGRGPGERAMEIILGDEGIDVLGVIAVSSNGKDCRGLKVTCSITREGEVIEGSVDKYGNDARDREICGDTLSILKDNDGLIIIGIGDPGKMDYSDEISKGAPITTKAVREVLARSSRGKQVQ